MKLLLALNNTDRLEGWEQAKLWHVLKQSTKLVGHMHRALCGAPRFMVSNPVHSWVFRYKIICDNILDIAHCTLEHYSCHSANETLLSGKLRLSCNLSPLAFEDGSPCLVAWCSQLQWPKRNMQPKKWCGGHHILWQPVEHTLVAMQ